MRKLLFCSVFFPIFLAAAGRNINGSTGYIMMPSAEGLRYQQYHLGLNAFTGTDDEKSHWKYNLGLGGAEGFELSVHGRSEREGLYLNTKWFGALNNYQNPLYVAIGFENLASMGTFQDYPNVFMVATKTFAGGHSISIGSAGRYIENKKEVISSMMLGGEMYTSETMSWLADAVAYAENKYNLNAGLRVYTSETSYFHFTLVNLLRTDVKRPHRDDADEEIDAYPFTATIGMTITNFL